MFHSIIFLFTFLILFISISIVNSATMTFFFLFFICLLVSIFCFISSSLICKLNETNFFSLFHFYHNSFSSFFGRLTSLFLYSSCPCSCILLLFLLLFLTLLLLLPFHINLLISFHHSYFPYEMYQELWVIYIFHSSAESSVIDYSKIC